MADVRKTFAALLSGDQVGKTVSGTDAFGEPFSGSVVSIVHMSPVEYSRARTTVRLEGQEHLVQLAGTEEVTVS